MNVAANNQSVRVSPESGLSTQDILAEMREQATQPLPRPPPVPAFGPTTPPASEAAPPQPAAGGAETTGGPVLADLLATDGVPFIGNAFDAILRRAPDPHGLAYYAGQLASGALSKVEVLGAIRYGREGRRIGVRVPGLLSRYVLLRSTRLRGIGRPIGLGYRMLRLPSNVERTHAALAGQLGDLRGAVERLTVCMQSRVAQLDHRLQQLEAQVPSRPIEPRLDALEALIAALPRDEWVEPLLALSTQIEDQVQRSRVLASQADDIAAVAAALRGLRAAQGWPNEDAAGFAERLSALSRDVFARAARAEATTQRNRAELMDQGRRLGLLLADVRKRLDQPFSAEEAERLEEADDHRLDPLYVAFEDQFRGTRADIRERQRAHLPTLRDAKAGSRERPIVDLGAGRGEWLELLRDEDLTATGVDANATMVALCGSLGLDCAQGDAVGYLRGLPADSLGAVTGFHIIEHLPFKVFVALLDECLRVLRPGGIVLFETPNPANILVGSRTFYLDPTHRNPMPGEMTRMIAEARGFVAARIHELHPVPARFEARDELLAAQLDRIFHGPQDYALIARKA